MALTSPGVQVTVIDESFYTPAEPGTTPLIVIATAQDKSNASGTGTAAGTTKANAGKAYKVTSQKDLVDFFGVPFFEKTASGSPIHGSERNEYGLLAAYSYLGASNAAFIIRADVDLTQLQPRTAAPGAEPTDGKWWIDTKTTTWGILEWNGSPLAKTSPNGQKFAAKTPIVLTDADDARVLNNAPRVSVGSIGDYAVVLQTVKGLEGIGSFTASKETARFYFKSPGNGILAAGTWVQVGSNDWCASWPVVVGNATGTLAQGDRYLVNGTQVQVGAGTTTAARLTTLAADITAKVQGVTANSVNNKLYIYSNGSTDIDGDSTLSGGVQFANDTGGDTQADLGIAPGTYLQPKLTHSPHTSVPAYKIADQTGIALAGYPTGSVWIKTTEPSNGSRWRVKRYNASTQAWVSYSAPLYGSTHEAIYYLDRSNGGAGLPVDSIVVQYNSDEYNGYTAPKNSGADSTLPSSSYKVWRRARAGATVITSNVVTTTFTGAKTFSIKESIVGQADLDAAKLISFTAVGGDWEATAIDIAGKINAAGFSNIEAAVTANTELQIYHKAGGDFRLIDGTGAPLNIMFTPYSLAAGTGTSDFYSLPTEATEDYLASNFQPLAAANFAAGPTTPLNEPTDGQLWYNNDFSKVDIMVHNGSTWKGYKQVFATTDPAGPQVSASTPTTQSDGTALVTNDLWISTADMENFPTIYRYSDDLKAWQLVDTADQTSETGILFADARYGTSGATGNTAASIVELLSNDFLDFDAPDPALYPKGMLLWNLRRSGGNVKRYANSYVDVTADNPRYNSSESMEAYAADRWVTASANQENGAGTFGRKAQRQVVVQALKSLIDTSSEIRDEERRNFNLSAAPGYPEVYSNLVNLNIDRKLTSFVIADTPLRLAADATTLINYGTNANGALDNGDNGVVTYDEYSALYYPNGFTTDLGGSNAVVPASHMMLKTIALSDQVSYPWFAPAGTRRGGITNATSVGYIDSLTGEFQSVALNEGTRDVLYDLKINPIPFFVGVGHVAFGQKTRARNASAVDRINVARLVVYLRSQLNKLARPYLFEPNDKITRDEIKGAVESLLLELVGLRALYDFAVVCDESNNTASRVDRNELYVDIAIVPVKAVEFIYIPLRVKNTGEI
jgi:hypothetical protein